MTDPLPFALVVVKTSNGLREIKSVRDAADALKSDWPKPKAGRRMNYRAAVRACLAAAAGEATAGSVRNAFIRAAMDADILVRTLELKEGEGR